MDAQLTRIIVSERIDRYQREAADEALARIVRDGRPGRPGLATRLLGVLRRERPASRISSATTTIGAGAARRAATTRTRAAS